MPLLRSSAEHTVVKLLRNHKLLIISTVLVLRKIYSLDRNNIDIFQPNFLYALHIIIDGLATLTLSRPWTLAFDPVGRWTGFGTLRR
jgi:hypothetical protein